MPPGPSHLPAALNWWTRQPTPDKLTNMNETNPPTGQPPEGSQPGGSDELYVGTVRTDQMGVGARVSERVASGNFSTGAIVLEGPAEFVIDFVQGIAKPPRVCARVVMAPPVMGSFVQALKENLQRYEAAFGPPKPLPPRPPQERRPSIQEIYENLRVPDENLSGSYATHAMIAHTPAEFYFDFITRFYPNAAVAARVYMAASQVPRLLEGVTAAFGNWQRRIQAMGQTPPPPPPQEPPPPETPEKPQRPQY